MSKKLPKADKDIKQSSNSAIHIGDLARYLLSLANLQNDPRTGNEHLSEGLRLLATALKPHSQKSIHDIRSIISDTRSNTRSSKSPEQQSTDLPPDLTAVTASVIEGVLNDQRYTKDQLIQMGLQRFGISRSRLMRLNRSQVIDAIRAALNHERSIGVIAEEARRRGENRSS